MHSKKSLTVVLALATFSLFANTLLILQNFEPGGILDSNANINTYTLSAIGGHYQEWSIYPTN